MFSFLRKKSLVKRAAIIGAVLVLLTGFLFVSCEQPAGIVPKDITQIIPDGDATLKSLVVDAGTLSPAFSASCLEYHVTVRNTVDSVTITATPSSSKTVVNGAGTKTLVEGDNTVTIGVNAENGVGNTYTITVKRLDSSVRGIESAQDMAKIGKDNDWPLAASYVLMNDITLENWKPIIGSNNEEPFSGVFNGNNKTITLRGFDNNFVGAYAYNNGTKYTNVFLGIFGAVKGASASAKAEIKDLKINSSVNVTSANQTASSGVGVGLLAGYAELAVIDNITLSGSFGYKYGGNNYSAYLGGIVGFIIGKETVIKNCKSSMVMDIKPGYNGSQIVPGNANAFSFVGGFVGFFKDGGGIENCHNTGAVSGISDVSGSQVMVGGILGGSHYAFSDNPNGYMEDCSSTGDITVGAKGFWPMAGGIAGLLAGGSTALKDSTRIVRCFASGTISLDGTSSGWPYLGGIVGYIYTGAKVSQCYFDGTVIVGSGNDYTGGIAGYSSYATGYDAAKNNPCFVEDCWSSGEVRGFKNAGGIVGQNQQNTLLKRSYSIAEIKVTSTASTGVGGIAGLNASTLTSEAVSSCVALNKSMSAPAGNNIHRVTGTTGGNRSNNHAWSGMTVTTGGTYTAAKGSTLADGEDCVEKPAQNFYERLGWNFTSVWKMGSNGYPKLRWQN